MRLKIGKKLKTASLNSTVTDSKTKNSVFRLVHFWKNLKPIAAVKVTQNPKQTKKIRF